MPLEDSMKNRTTYGLRLDQMADIFSMGADDPDPADEEQHGRRMADLLREQLACPMPKGSVFCDVMLMMMTQSGGDPRLLAGKSLQEVLLDPQTDIGLLQAIKDCSKRLSCMLDSEAETALATTVYFAALAGALVYHDQKITQSPYEKLNESFALLIEKTWMAGELVELFHEARRICESKRDLT
jgi:hypothetical protein